MRGCHFLSRNGPGERWEDAEMNAEGLAYGLGESTASGKKEDCRWRIFAAIQVETQRHGVSILTSVCVWDKYIKLLEL